MSGFIRGSQRKAYTKGEVACAIVRFIGEQEIATLLREQDPFCCDDPCPGNAAGHYPIRAAGDIVCAHAGCGKVFWR